MSREALDFGKAAEELAAGFLQGKGYRILKRNYKNRFGEIDIIARQNGVVCFVEVKARHTVSAGLPQEAVGAAKQRQISGAAVDYLKSHKLLDSSARFDVVSLYYDKDEPQITLIQNAFELSAGLTI